MEKPPEFPPHSGSVETRYCIGEKIVFKLDHRQRKEYFNATSPMQPQSATKAENTALFVGRVHYDPSWKEKDALHASQNGRWNVYVLRMDDGSYYVGQSRKPQEERFLEHKNGLGARVCRERGVEKLVYFTETASRQVALEAEAFLVAALRKMGLNATHGMTFD